MSAEPHWIAGLLALALWGGTSPAAASPEPSGEPGRFLAAARAVAIAEAVPTTAAACAPARADAAGRVVADPRPTPVAGEGRSATGGLGRPLVMVTSLADSDGGRSRAIPGTLRWAVESARLAGGWIAFDPALEGGTLRLSASLRLPSDVTLDGGCGGITLSAAPRTTALVIANASNIVIRGLRFTKDAYQDLTDRTGDAIGLSDGFDRVAVLHNAFERCGDGCIDAVRRRENAVTGRLTVAFNHFADHNKVLLIGALLCYGARPVAGCETPLEHLSGIARPLLRVTLLGNLFEDTSQRQPKVVTGAFVHSVNNLIVLRATPYPDGRASAVYGAAAASGGLLAVEGDIVLNPTGRPRLGAGPISATRERDGGPETDGAVLVRGVVGIGPVRVAENRPDLVRPLLTGAATALDAGQDPQRLAACILRLAGPQGVLPTGSGACERFR